MDDTAWQLPTYVTLAVIGGGMAVGLLVICIICGFCTIFNRKYDNEQRKRRQVTIQTVATVDPLRRPSERLHAVPPRPILTVRNLASGSCMPQTDSEAVCPTGEDQGSRKAIMEIRPGMPAVSLSTVGPLYCQHCSNAFPIQVTRTSQGGTMTSVLRHACACTLFMSTSASERSITGDELRQLASSTELLFVASNSSKSEDPRASRRDELSPLLTRDTDPLIVISDSTSSETLETARTRKIQAIRQLSQKLDLSTSSCCGTPQEEPVYLDNVTRGAPSRPVHVHPLLHPHFHAHSKDDLPVEQDSDSPLVLAEAEVHVPTPAFQSLELPVSSLAASQSASPISDYDVREMGQGVTASLDGNEPSSDPCKALWGLRSVLEHRTGVQLEPVIRLIAESDNEVDIELDQFGNPIAPYGGHLRPGNILTSLTSFESNTPSEESFDATNCAKALEAIFDEPSDLPILPTSPNTYSSRSVSSCSSIATVLYASSGTHLTPPVHRQQRKPSPPKLTSHQKRQSFKKAHHLAASASPKTASAVSQAVAVELKVVTVDEVSPARSFSVSHPVENQKAPTADIERTPRSPSPHRLQQMKNDSGYKSQSLDQSSTAPQVHIQAYKSVPSLPSELVAEEPISAGHGQNGSSTENYRVCGYDISSLEVPSATFFLSASTDNEMEDAISCASSAVPSLTSSMDIEAAYARIPLLLTQPATPTTPPRDWTIDERSDRLFREFSRRETSTSTRTASLRSSVARQHRSLLPKRKSYSPSSSHSGTPAQASIEETEEEEEHTLCGPSVVSATVAPLAVTVVERAGQTPTPDYFVCSTKEQLQTQINLRENSPELRHVPIIKLPDQASEEV